jgi:hypothetical protein
MILNWPVCGHCLRLRFTPWHLAMRIFYGKCAERNTW